MKRFWWRLRFTLFGWTEYDVWWWDMSGDSYDAYNDDDRYLPTDQFLAELSALLCS